MVPRRLIGNALAMLVMFLAQVLPESWLKSSLVCAGSGYILGALVFRAHAGYVRRRPYWTPASWRGYLAACVLALGALLISVGMMVAIEWRLPIAGASNSSARGAWAAGMMGFMVVGVIGLVIAVEWLADGEPSRQFGLK